MVKTVTRSINPAEPSSFMILYEDSIGHRLVEMAEMLDLGKYEGVDQQFDISARWREGILTLTMTEPLPTPGASGGSGPEVA